MSRRSRATPTKRSECCGFWLPASLFNRRSHSSMRFIIALFIPPLAVLLCGKPFQAIVNLLFWLASLPLLFVMGLGALVWVCPAPGNWYHLL